MDPKFPWKKYVNQINPYFKKWGFEVSQLDAEYYSQLSGIRADHYVTRSMAFHYIYAYLDRYDFASAYMDKSTQKRLLGMPNNHIDVLMPEDVVSNVNGVFFDGDGVEIPRQTASEILVAYGDDTILKPSSDSVGGHGVMKAHGGGSVQDYLALFDKYHYNFTFQKIIVQHPVIAEFNPTSVNTIRVVTYRDMKRDRKVLYACLRFGSEGSVMDNVCSGGGYTEVDLETGHLKNRKRYSYYQMDVPLIPDNMPNEIPSWNRIKRAALELHGRLPHMDILGWDFTVLPDGKPLLIEFNARPGIGLQQAVGPMFSLEDLDELMEHVSKVRTEYLPLGVVNFKNRPELRYVNLKYGGK